MIFIKEILITITKFSKYIDIIILINNFYIFFYRTPPYRDLNITTPKEVFIQLERPSDGDCSEPIKFTYKPSDRIISKLYI